MDYQKQNSSDTSFSRTLATINLFIAIIGYPVVMALLSPMGVDLDISSGENRLITWPYRALALLIGIATLLAVRARPMPKFDWRLSLFLFFWVIYLVRAIYDLSFRSDLQTYKTSQTYYQLQAWNSIIFSTLIPLIAIFKSIDIIDFRRISNWIFYIGSTALIASLFSIQKVADASWSGEITGRTNASAMLNTISFGHLGLSVAIVALYKTASTKVRFFERLLGIFVILLGGYIILKAGSRGPIFCAFIIMLFYAFSRSRYAFIGLFLGSIFAGSVYIFFEQTLNLINMISPAMAYRISLFVYEGDSSGRDSLITDYWREICENPITGVHLDILGYSHNACFDGLLMFGFIFGWIILVLVLIGYKSNYRLLKEGNTNWWIALLGIQSLTAIQTSGTFGANSFVQSLWIIACIWTSRQPSINHLKPFYLSKKNTKSLT